MSAIFTRKKKEKKGSGDESSDRLSNGTSKPPKKRTGEPPRPIFGVPLATAVKNSRSHDGQPIPLLVRDCIDYVTENGLNDEGIFRISASKNKLDELEKAANFGDPIVFTDPHDAACLLKRFLRQLPEHILTDRLKPEIDRIAAGCKCEDDEPCKCETVELLADCLRQLPQENFYLLGYVFRHSQSVVMKSDINKMSLRSLGVILQAMLNLSKNEVRIFLFNAASDLASQLNKGLITELFADVRFERYCRPKNADEIHTVIIPSEQELIVEIRKQESLLDDLHEQLRCLPDKKSSEAKAKEQHIWNVQSTITTLKRQWKQIQAGNPVPKPLPPAEPPTPSESSLVQLGDPPAAFLEKQLLATCSSLENDNAEEKRRIAQLLSRLRELQRNLTPEQVAAIEGKPTESTAEKTTADSSETASVSVDLGAFNDECERLEKRLNELRASNAHYREVNSKLRARLEHYNTILNSVRQAKSEEEIVSTCLSVGGVVQSPAPPSAAAPQSPPIAEDSNPVGSLLVTRF